ncbi:Sialidase [Dactylonectria macrodidyma]|uniref:Sialidase n=1 Tax=Dactylonectria macrodidyma TaxID=307937 RepID=A0A9P9D094_9HYPO|nr:Sialidase [Dactylonectria macrodidyma]
MRNADKLPNGIGFHSFRIPAVVTTTTGRILTFAEGRRHNNRDYGDVNLVYKRTKTTKSHGESPSDWDALREVVGKGDGTWGNPTPVVDGSTIYLFLSWNHGAYSQNGGDTLPSGKKTMKINNSWEGRRHIFLTQSADDGKTWSEPVDMTKQLTPDGWSWDAVGPGIGITLSSGELVVPAQRRNIIGRGKPGKRIWSYQSLNGAGSEGTVAQTPDGRLYRNDRASADDGYRKVARGSLSTFSPFVLDKGLPDPACEASTLLYNKGDANGPARTLFMNSAHKSSRRHMRVRISYDGDAKKFNYGRKLSDAPISGVGFEGGYSSLTKTADRKVGALVETDFYQAGGSEKDHRAIVWRRFNLSWILNSPNN